MDYEISQSRWENLIDKFIKNYVGKLTKVDKPDFNYSFWVDENGSSIFHSDNDESLGVVEDLWNALESTFSLTSYQTRLIFLSWAEKNLNLKINYEGSNVDDIFTFER